jgi:hypothetical protein
VYFTGCEKLIVSEVQSEESPAAFVSEGFDLESSRLLHN